MSVRRILVVCLVVVGVVGIGYGLGVATVGLGAVAPTAARVGVAGLKVAGVGIVAKEMYAPIVLASRALMLL